MNAPRVERIGILLLHLQLRLPQSLGARLSPQDAAIKILHQLPRLLVRHFPQTHHQRLRPRQPRSPAANRTRPRPCALRPGPVSQADNTTNSVASKSSPDTSSAVSSPSSASAGKLPPLSQVLNPASNTPERSNGLRHPRPRHPIQHTFWHLAKTISGLPCGASRDRAIPGSDRAAGRQEKSRASPDAKCPANGKPAASLDARFQRFFAQQWLHAEHPGDALPFHSRPRQWSQLP